MSITVEATHHTLLRTTPSQHSKGEEPAQLGLFEGSLSEVQEAFLEQVRDVTTTSLVSDDPVEQYMRYFVSNQVTSTLFLNALAAHGAHPLLRSVAPNLLPALVTEPSMRYMIQAADAVVPPGVSTEFGRLDYGFSLTDRIGAHLGSPLDLTWSNYSLIEDGTMRLPGPMIVSFNHRVLASSEFSEEYKRMSLACELFAYLVRYQGLVLSIPKRKPGSLTDRLLGEYNPVVKDVHADEDTVHTLYFITWNGIPSELKEWFFKQNHPVVTSLRAELHQSQNIVTWSDPSRNLFDLSADWTEEYSSEVRESEQYLKYITALIEAQRELFSTLLPTWLTIYAARVGDDQDWTDWMLANLTGTAPMQLALQAQEFDDEKLNTDARKLLARRSFYT